MVWSHSNTCIVYWECLFRRSKVIWIIWTGHQLPGISLLFTKKHGFLTYPEGVIRLFRQFEAGWRRKTKCINSGSPNTNPYHSKWQSSSYCFRVSIRVFILHVNSFFSFSLHSLAFSQRSPWAGRLFEAKTLWSRTCFFVCYTQWPKKQTCVANRGLVQTLNLPFVVPEV